MDLTPFKYLNSQLDRRFFLFKHYTLLRSLILTSTNDLWPDNIIKMKFINFIQLIYLIQYCAIVPLYTITPQLQGWVFNFLTIPSWGD